MKCEGWTVKGAHDRNDRVAVLFVCRLEGGAKANEDLVLLKVDPDAGDDLGELIRPAVGDDLGEELRGGHVEVGGRGEREEYVALRHGWGVGGGWG